MLPLQVGEQELRELLEGQDIRNRGVIEYDEFLAGVGAVPADAPLGRRPVGATDSAPAGGGEGCGAGAGAVLSVGQQALRMRAGHQFAACCQGQTLL